MTRRSSSRESSRAQNETTESSSDKAKLNQNAPKRGGLYFALIIFGLIGLAVLIDIIRS